MAAHQSREVRIYLALWRKALHSEVRFLVPSKAASISIRQGLYRAIKPYREAKVFDSELLQAAETLVVVNSPNPVDENGNFSIHFQPRLTTEILDLDRLGLSETDLLSLEEQEALDRVKSLTESVHNPFGNLRDA